jgi:hypothetical protein
MCGYTSKGGKEFKTGRARLPVDFGPECAYFQNVMTPKERMRLVMAGLIPDRVPLMCQMSIGHMLRQTGATPAAFWNSAEVFGEGLLALRQAYDFDGILISLHGHSPGWEKRASRIDREESSQVVRWKNGDVTVFPDDDLPVHYSANPRKPVRLENLDPESIPDAVDFIPVSQGLEFPLDPDHLFDVIDQTVEEAGRDFSIHGEVTSPFDYYLNLVGFSEGFMGLLENPGKAKAVLERYAGAVKRLAVAMTGHKVDAIKVSSPYAGSGFISPLFYREFVLPFESEIARAVRERGVPPYVHTCGAIHDRLEMMIEAGFAGLECLDPPPLGNVELGDAKRRIGERAFIKGNIDPVNVLLKGIEEEVREDAQSKLAAGKPSGGYILSTACSIAPHTPKENILMLRNVVDESGWYS